MPPIMVATCWPTGNSPPEHWATTPAASMPRTRGNVTPDATPWRVCSSERFSPNALPSLSTRPAAGLGTASSRIVSASGGPGASRTIARMVSVIRAPVPDRSLLVACEVVEEPVEHGRERLQLFLRQRVEEVATDGLRVLRRRFFDRGRAVVGEAHHRAPSILRALLAGDEPPFLHPSDEM